MTALSNSVARSNDNRYINRHRIAAPLLEQAHSLPKGIVGIISAFLAFDCSDGTFSKGTLGAAFANGTIVDYYKKVVDVFAKNKQKIMLHKKPRDLSDFTQFASYLKNETSTHSGYRMIKRLFQQEPQIYDDNGYPTKPKNPGKEFLENQENIDKRLTILIAAWSSIYEKFNQSMFCPFWTPNTENLKPEEVNNVNKKHKQEAPFRDPFRIFVFLTFEPEDFLAIAEGQDPLKENSNANVLFNRIFEIAMRNREWFPCSIRPLYPNEIPQKLSSKDISSDSPQRQMRENTEKTIKIRIQNYLAQEASNQSPTLSSSSSAPSSASATSSSAVNTTTSGGSISSTASSAAASQKASENKEAC